MMHCYSTVTPHTVGDNHNACGTDCITSYLYCTYKESETALGRRSIRFDLAYDLAMYKILYPIADTARRAILHTVPHPRPNADRYIADGYRPRYSMHSYTLRVNMSHKDHATGERCLGR